MSQYEFVRHPDPKFGQIYSLYFSGNGSVQKGWRPGVIIQNNLGNKKSPNIVALPLTSRKQHYQPTHVFLRARDNGLPRDSFVLCENPATLPKSSLGNFITSLDRPALVRIAIAYSIASPLPALLSEENMKIIQEAVKDLNKLAVL